MTQYLLDTDALIDFSNTVEPITSKILAWVDGNDVVALCPITVTEFFAGLAPEEIVRWRAAFSVLPFWQISREAAIQAGQYRYTFARVGRHITTTDALIAAVAHQYQATVVTGNVKHFPMDCIPLLSIR